LKEEDGGELEVIPCRIFQEEKARFGPDVPLNLRTKEEYDMRGGKGNAGLEGGMCLFCGRQ